MGVWSPWLPPGQPEKVTTRSTPSSAARRTASSKSSWKSRATCGSGCTGLPWQESAAIFSPLSDRMPRNSFCFSLLPKSSLGSQCCLPGLPPQPISTASTPWLERKRQASAKGSPPSTTEKTDSIMINPPLSLRASARGHFQRLAEAGVFVFSIRMATGAPGPAFKKTGFRAVKRWGARLLASSVRASSSLCPSG